MKSIIILCLFLIPFSFLSAQQISRSVLTTGGGTIKNDKGGSISWSMGELFNPTVQEEFHITAGFQQGVIQVIDTKMKKEQELLKTSLEKKSITCHAFPNPMSNQLSLKLNGLEKEALLNIVTSSGRIVLSQNITSSDTDVAIEVVGIESLISGIYHLQLITKEKVIQTQKLVKI